MNKIIKVCSIFFLMIFSFYYTEKVALYVQNNTPLKKEIISYKESNNILFVNADINGDYIIPGINGLEVNVNKSYNNMKSYNVFNEKYLVYDQVTPEISVSNFKNKIINMGNVKKGCVSIIINGNDYVNYFKSRNINYDFLTKTNYCIKVNDYDCKNNSKQIVEPTIILNNLNILREMSSINKGYIIYINNDISFNYLNSMINHIKYNNLNICKVNDHLSENYTI